MVKLLNVSEFLDNYRFGGVKRAKELRLNDSGTGTKSYILDVEMQSASMDFVLSGVVLLISGTEVLARERVYFRVGVGQFLMKPYGVFSAFSSGYTSDLMYFDVDANGQYGMTFEGEFQKGRMMGTRDVKEKRNDFDTENWGFHGGHESTPTEIPVLFRGLGTIVNIPVGRTVEALLTKYAEWVSQSR